MTETEQLLADLGGDTGSFLVVFPVYTLAHRSPHGAYTPGLLRAHPPDGSAPERQLPLFTDRDSADTFVRRAGLTGTAEPIELATPAALAGYVRGGVPAGVTRAVVDPLRPDAARFTWVELDELIRATGG
jgi:hypothetical protein